MHRFVALAVLLFALGCNTAFRDAMQRGDQLAGAGEWDQAAVAYEQAVGLEPDDEDAQRKLAHARREQSKLRVAKGWDLMRLGDARGALVPFVEAVRLDPKSAAAHQGLEAAKQTVLAQAKQALEEGRYKDSYALARAFLDVDPTHPGALQVELAAKEKIAETAFARGTAAEQAGKKAVALVDYGETLQFKPDHAEAKQRADTLRRAFREEVTFWVALKNFDGDPNADGLGSDVDAASLANGLDAALPLRVVDNMPKPKSYKVQGMRLGGVFRHYDYDHVSSRTSQSCDYICGRELVDNPAYATADANMRSAQVVLATAEGRVSTAKSAIGPAERARDSAKSSYDAKKAEAARAEQDLSQCRSNAAGQSGACAAEEQRKTRADEDEKLAAEEARRTESALQNANAELSNAETDLLWKANDAASKKATFESTPVKIEIDKHCLHNYAVDTVIVSGELECLLSGESLYDTQNVLNRSVVGRVSRTDQTFPAQAGVCAEVSSGDPLQVPTEAEVKKLVLGSAVALAQKEILAAFGRYREAYATRGRTFVADAKGDDATDAFVRYLFTLPADDGSGTTKESIAKAASVRSVDDTAVRIAVFGAHSG